MSDWSYEMDRMISNMSPNRRILYFKSEDRGVIRQAVDRCGALQARLGMKESGEGSFDQLVNLHKGVSLTQIYEAGKVVGTIRLQKGRNKITGETVEIVPDLVFLTDYQVFSENDRNLMIKTFLDAPKLRERLLLIASPEVLIPDGFSNEIELIMEPNITEKDIYERIANQIREEERYRGKTFYSDKELKEFAKDFTGLTRGQVGDILNALYGELCVSLRAEKGESKVKALIRQERIKEAQKDPAIRLIELGKTEQIAGLGHYMKWLQDRKTDFWDPSRAKKQGTPAPKGVLLCGVPGTGKTAMARETARVYRVPLVQFDISRIQNSKFGESEARLSRYLDRISAFGSCVMLMDEVEKSFSVNDSTHEVKLAMLGKLLDWMQSRTANVLTFITANNISKLPAELLRDGRISGRFFAFMPSRDDLAAIMRIKLKDLTAAGIFNEELRRIILRVPETKRELEQDPLAGIIDQIASRAKEKKKAGEIRWPFMTGANMEVLIEMTLRELKKSGVAQPYSFKAYETQMCLCALSQDFVPQGQSNMEDIVEMWLGAQKRQYQDVSENTLLPFSKFKNGKFTQKLTADNLYDQFLIDILKEEIETAARKAGEQEAAVKKYAKETESVS